MFKRIFAREHLLLLFIILTGSVFLLSALGKYFDIAAFRKTMQDYGLPAFVVYFVLAIEFIIVTCFMLLSFLKKTSVLATLFLILTTIAYSIGHFIIGLSSCNCFGLIDVLNSDNFTIYIVKNSILIALSIFIFQNFYKLKKRIWLKRFLTTLMTLLIAFLVLKYNEYYLENYSKRKIGLPLKDLRLNVSEIENYDYLFIFSPSCSHCINAIPNIISLKKKYSLKLAGITLKSKEEELKKVNADFEINFNIVKIDNKTFDEITKAVPVIFKIKNDTIQNIFNPKDLLANIISSEKLIFSNQASNYPSN